MSQQGISQLCPVSKYNVLGQRYRIGLLTHDMLNNMFFSLERSHLEGLPSWIDWNATPDMLPSMSPNAVHICHIMTNAPRMLAGVDSAAKTGMVALLAPIPKPEEK